MGRSLFGLLCVPTLLTGCAATTTFVDRTNGEEYKGTTGATTFAEGELSAIIEGAPYSGHWIISPTAAAYSIGTGVAMTRGAMAVSTGSAVAVSAQGNGLVNMRSPDGQFIRCVFNFSGFSNTGMGECQRNDGREYDLRIKR